MPPKSASQFPMGLAPTQLGEMLSFMGSGSRMEGRVTSFQDLMDDIEGRNRVDFSNPEDLIARYGLPTPKSFPKPAEVRKEAKTRATNVLAHWRNLKDIIQRHEATLGKRWAKKTKSQRVQVLLKAWPGMSTKHRPDYDAFRRESPQQRVAGTKFKEAYMWPFINLEDLSSKSLMMLFISSRAWNSPAQFARADFDATHLARITQAMMPAFLNEYTLFIEGDTVETYGRLVSWEEDDTAFEMMSSMQGYIPGEGLMALESQEKTYAFLVKCCEILLEHELKEGGSLVDERFPILEAPVVKEPEFIPHVDGENWPTLTSIATEAPFRLPTNLDFNRIKAVIAAKRSAAEDHLLAMREDPGYFADTVKDWSEHRNDAMLDTNGDPHPTGPHTTTFWERVIRNVIGAMYSDFMSWDMFHRKVIELAALKEKYKDTISADKKLPKEYLIAILKFRELLKVSCETPLHRLQNIQSSPPLRHIFTRGPQDPSTINMYIHPRPGAKPPAKLWFILNTLWNPDQRFLFGLPSLVDEFEYTIQDPNEKAYLSAYIQDQFSNLGVLAHSWHELNIYQPWAEGFDNDAVEYEMEITTGLRKDTLTEAKFMSQMDTAMTGITEYGMPAGGRFTYPSDKRRTKQNTEKMIEAENNLDRFWSLFDARWKKMVRKTINESMGEHVPCHQDLPLERTTPWVEATPSPKPNDKIDLDSFKDLEILQPEYYDPTSLVPKTKLKTRGVARKGASQPAPTAQGSQPDKQPRLKVDRRTLKVFNTIFHVPNATDQPGEIPWRDFLYAMASAGFAPQKLYGSIWQFTPRNLDVERSIQFHEPHPGAKLRFTWSRSIGRRLARAYGWHSGIFVLGEKTTREKDGIGELS